MTDTWYSYCPDDGVQLHGSAEEARARAQSVLEDIRPAQGEEWHPDIERLSWGRLEEHERATETDRQPVMKLDEHDEEYESDDYTCDYVLQGHDPGIIVSRWARGCGVEGESRPVVDVVKEMERLPKQERIDILARAVQTLRDQRDELLRALQKG